MPLTEARSLARHAVANARHSRLRATNWKWLEHHPEQDLQQLKQLAADCDRFSHRVGYEEIDPRATDLTDTGCLWLDATSHHRLSPAAATAREQHLLEDVANLFHHRGYYVAAALADTLGAAWAVAHFEQLSEQPSTICGPRFFTPHGETLDALFSLPIEALRLENNTVETLHNLGIQTIEQLWELPRAELPARFGEHLLQRMDQAQGKIAETFTAYRTTPPLTIELHLDRPTDRRELLTECLRDLLKKLCEQMQEQNRSALRVLCSLEMAQGEMEEGRTGQSQPSQTNESASRTLSVGLFQPSHDPNHLLKLFEMQLERQTIPHPVRYIALTVTVNVRPEQGQVQWLPGMEDAAGDRAIRSAITRDMAGLVEHLSCRLGGQSVLGVRLTAEPQIERAFHFRALTGDASGTTKKSTPAALRRHQATATARPPQVFTPAIRLHLNPGRTQQNNHSWNHIPQSICVQNRSYRVIQHWGPERIETNWWRGGMLQRDYYRFEDEHGHHWWAYYDLQEHDWFVQGAF